MAGRIPQDFIEELLARTDVVEVIGSRLTLRKTGLNYTGLCPFHNEKTPSFSVSADKQFYYCFGCQESGSALKFVMEFDRLDFFAAVEYLCQRVGLQMPEFESNQSDETLERQKKKKKSLYDVLASANDFYKTQLREHPRKEQAISYLKSRGLTGKVARDYEIGYAPPGWDHLLRALATTNQDRQLLIEAGMLIDLPEEDKTYDRFRERVIFPIKDIRGRVVGFGGRIIGDGKPKYLNSPETPVFHKGRELYGLYEARKSSRQLERIIVVEGYMDVVALSQHGIGNAVATLGTSTSKDHLERLYRMVSEVVFCFDGDNAGRKAAWKALEEALPLLRDGRIARFLFLPDGEDPDSLIRKHASEKHAADKFQLLVENSRYLPDFFFEHLGDQVDAESMEGKAALSRLVMPLISRIPEGVFKQLMLDRLADVTGLSLERLLEVAQLPGAAAARPAASPGAAVQGNRNPVRGGRDSSSLPASNTFVESALRLVLKQPELISQFDAATYLRLADLPECKLLKKLAETVNEEPNISPSLLISRFQDSEEFVYLKKVAETEELLKVEQWQAEYDGIIRALLSRLDKEAAEQERQEFQEKSPSSLTADEKRAYRTLLIRK